MKNKKNLLLSIPNMPDETILVGPDESANVVKKVVGEVIKPSFEQKPHWDLTVEKDLVDFERGVKISIKILYIQGQRGKTGKGYYKLFLRRTYNKTRIRRNTSAGSC